MIFEMQDFERRSIINSHKFYVEQAKNRILSQFDNLEGEIEEIAQDIYNKSGKNFDPDYDDPADLVEPAYEAANDHLIMLYEMRDQTLFSIIAGMFHQFDKSLREWIERESRLWAGDIVNRLFWGKDIGKLYKLFESLGWSVTQEPFFKKLDACRLIVNVYKHGKGGSLTELRRDYPEYFFDFKDPNFNINDWYDHSSINVTDQDFEIMSDAIVAFWEALPKKFLDNDDIVAPQWLTDSLATEAKKK